VRFVSAYNFPSWINGGQARLQDDPTPPHGIRRLHVVPEPTVDELTLDELVEIVRGPINTDRDHDRNYAAYLELDRRGVRLSW